MAKIKKLKKAVLLSLAALVLFLPAGCLSQSAAPDGSGLPGRFERAEKLGQFNKVNRSADCQGTTVTIEKILFDKTGTFIIAAVEGEVRGEIDPLNVKLFDGQEQNLGWNSFLPEYPVELPGNKTLLTFDPVEGPPESLRLEFSGGPVKHGDGPVVLDLQGIKFKIVDQKYVRTYQLAEAVEKNGYRLLVDAIITGISETQIRYKLTARGDYDGVAHGPLHDWPNNYRYRLKGGAPAMRDGGRELTRHLSSIDNPGPSYRVSRDEKTAVGRANFDPPAAGSLQLSLTDVYGYYAMDQLIPLAVIAETGSINKKIPVKGYIVCLNSFVKEDEQTRTLGYTVLDSAGNKVDAVIDACVCEASHNYGLPLTSPIRLKDAPDGERLLVMSWPQWESEEEIMGRGPAIKITKLGFKQEDALLDINLDSPSRDPDDRAEKAVMGMGGLGASG